MKKKIAIVGIFYDGYYDLWEDFLELISIHWPDCPYDVYIIDGEKNVDFEKHYNVKVIHAGADAEYSAKVQTALKNIDADYFLLLLEDFFFEKRVKTYQFDDIVSLMEKNRIKYLRMPMFDFSGKGDNKKHIDTLDKESTFHFIPSSSEYTVSCQPSIWEKEFLKDCIGVGNYNAWIFEGIYTYSQYAHSDEFLSKCRIDFKNILGLRHGAVQGKMLPNVCAAFAKQGYVFKNKRGQLSRLKYNIYQLRQKFVEYVPMAIMRFVRRCSGKSVVEKYHTEIEKYMKLNNLV